MDEGKSIVVLNGPDGSASTFPLNSVELDVDNGVLGVDSDKLDFDSDKLDVGIGSSKTEVMEGFAELEFARIPAERIA